MSSIRLKICGMRNRTNILEVAAIAPDYMGFIFFPGSKRFVGEDFKIPEQMPSLVRRVGVFVNQPVTDILKAVQDNKLELVQLHGDEPARACEEIRKYGIRVIKAFRVDDDFDFEDVSPYRETADYFLFDAKGKDFGGNGVAFDWNRLNEYDQSVPFFLSGGISPDDIDAIVNLKGLNLHAIDVNSRVEKEPGIKDVSLIQRCGRMLNQMRDV